MLGSVTCDNAARLFALVRALYQQNIPLRGGADDLTKEVERLTRGRAEKKKSIDDMEARIADLSAAGDKCVAYVGPSGLGERFG